MIKSLWTVTLQVFVAVSRAQKPDQKAVKKKKQKQKTKQNKNT